MSQTTNYIEFYGIENPSYDSDQRTLTIEVPMMVCEHFHWILTDMLDDLDLTKSQTVELAEKIRDKLEKLGSLTGVSFSYNPSGCPHVSLQKQGKYMFLCTYKLDGEDQMLFHDLLPSQNKGPIGTYLFGLDGTVTNVWYWQSPTKGTSQDR